jgi:hypothetical protein
MRNEAQQGLTLILGRARAGDERARGELVALVYHELRRVAARLMRRERPDHRKSKGTFNISRNVECPL